ncbi:hypothetical protein DTL42_01090 [Bremerella cremea]|uniref:Uncharacterized protein n=1 Tax=Bremerella cremea TaxID=1031537 RepID=A0A368KXP0_9BACT|nr:hypothetical protein [Bremerella cremea]RCS56013.1 hypothetical protein DTL42_01090 [Bremerella cremea]
MRWLLAWVTSFSRKERIVNRAVRELAEIVQQRANLSASISSSEQSLGYQQARLRRYVREYLATIERGQPVWSASARERLTRSILEQLAQQNVALVTVTASSEALPRQVA